MDEKVTGPELLQHFCAVMGCEELASHHVIIRIDPTPRPQISDEGVPQLVLEPDLRVCGNRKCWAFIEQTLNAEWVQGAVEETVGHKVQPVIDERLHHEFKLLRYRVYSEFKPKATQ